MEELVGGGDGGGSDNGGGVIVAVSVAVAVGVWVGGCGDGVSALSARQSLVSPQQGQLGVSTPPF